VESPEREFREPPREVDVLARQVINAAVEVHRHLGPGYAEVLYEKALVIEFGLRGIPFERQASFRVDYKGQEVGDGRMDLLVGRMLIVELKAVERFHEVHISQALAYPKATGLSLALLINFNVPVLMRGVKRVVMNRSRMGEEHPASVGSREEAA
jgi:GxxExxY protein